jgi:hypothetical protein
MADVVVDKFRRIYPDLTDVSNAFCYHMTGCFVYRPSISYQVD